MRYVLHQFRPSETIDAVIRLKGRHAYTNEEMRHLRRAFDELNGKIVPRPGMQYKIPLPFETVDEYGNLVDTTPPEPIEDDQGTVSATPGDDRAPEPVKVVDSVPTGPATPAAPVDLSSANPIAVARAQKRAEARRQMRLALGLDPNG